jgi:hypothetical protein
MRNLIHGPIDTPAERDCQNTWHRVSNAKALNLLKAPPHPALSPNAGERVGVRGIREYVKRLNAFVLVINRLMIAL